MGRGEKGRKWRRAKVEGEIRRRRRQEPKGLVRRRGEAKVWAKAEADADAKAAAGARRIRGWRRLAAAEELKEVEALETKKWERRLSERRNLRHTVTSEPHW